MLNFRRNLRSMDTPAVFLLITVLSVLAGETLVMFFLPLFRDFHLDVALLDSLLLTALMLPMLYLFMYRPLRNYIAERDQAVNALRGTNRLLDAVNAVQSRLIEGTSNGELFAAMLEGAAGLSQSGGGLIGEVVGKGEGKPAIVVRAVKSDGGNGAFAHFAAGAPLPDGEGCNIRPLIDLAVGEAEPAFSPPLSSGAQFTPVFLVLPLFNGAKLVGVIALSGRPGGYDEALIAGLRPYLITCAKIIRAHAIERQNERTQEELRAARDQAEEAVKLKNKFISMVAHDLNSPLSAVMLSLNYMEREKDARSGLQGKGIVHQMKTTVEEMMRMIKELLELARLQTGTLVPRRSVVDVRFVVTIAVGISARSAHVKGVRIVNDIPPDTLLYIDPDLIGEVFQNLISNAVKFCHPGGTVTIFHPEEAANVIAVKDTGVGLEKEALENIFSAGNNITTIGTAGERGTGLGIPLCMDILRAHGGTMTVESEKGKGATFHLFIPSQAGGARAAAQTATPAA